MDSPYSALGDGEASQERQDGEASPEQQTAKSLNHLRARSNLREAVEEKPISSEENGLLALVDGGGYWVGEAKAQCSLAWAIMLTNLLSFSFIVVTVMFVGHLGEFELSSAAIANSFVNVTGFSVMMGLGSALETLCGQAYGAKEYHRMGAQLQAAWIVGLSFCVPIGVMWWNLEKILVWLGQDAVISEMAAMYCRYTIPGMLSGALFNPLLRFLQAQTMVIPQLCCALTTALLHPVFCYLFIYYFGFGYLGGALANVVSYTLLFLLLVSYMLFSGKCDKTWNGFQLWEAIGVCPTFVRLAVPSVVMLCLKLWSFEMLLLLSGLLPNPALELSFLSIILNTSTLIFMIPFGFGGAASTRVSNSLGANLPGAANTAVKVALTLASLQCLVISTLLIIVRNDLAYAYTNVEEVLAYVSKVMPLLAISTFIDGLQGVLSGVVRGCGKQTLGAVINLGAFYGIGMPVAIVLGFTLHLNSTGLLLGLTSGLASQTALLSFFILRTDWKKMAQQAQERIYLRSQPSYLQSLQAPGDEAA